MIVCNHDSFHKINTNFNFGQISTIYSYMIESRAIIMKKLLKIISCLVILWCSLFTIDYIRYLNHQKPLIIIYSAIYDCTDGSMYVYASLGYKYVEYNRSSVSIEKELIPSWQKLK